MHVAIGNKRRGDPLDELERKVMELYADGRTQQQVSLALGISPTTVWYRASCAKKKLGATNLREASVKFALGKR